MSDRDDALRLLDAAPFMHLVTADAGGLGATSLPMLVDTGANRLVGHLARANDHWRRLDGTAVLVIAVPSEAYVSPGWYPSKPATGGRVVPTWNYEAVHVRGVARVHEDAAWLSGVVRRLTETHEARRTDGGEPWEVDDAPAEFIDQQLRAIVGVSVSIDKVDAKQKLSANRSDDDRRGVIAGLSASASAPARMIGEMTDALE